MIHTIDIWARYSPEWWKTDGIAFRDCVGMVNRPAVHLYEGTCLSQTAPHFPPKKASALYLCQSEIKAGAIFINVYSTALVRIMPPPLCQSIQASNTRGWARREVFM
jgi:hypothetical protein